MSKKDPTMDDGTELTPMPTNPTQGVGASNGSASLEFGGNPNHDPTQRRLNRHRRKGPNPEGPLLEVALPSTPPSELLSSRPLPTPTPTEDIFEEVAPPIDIEGVIARLCRADPMKLVRNVVMATSLFNISRWSPRFREDVIRAVRAQLLNDASIVEYCRILQTTTQESDIHYETGRAARAVAFLMVIGTLNGLGTLDNIPVHPDDLTDIETDEA